MVSDKNIGVASGLTFVYSGLFFVEGIGLYLEKVWAEFLTIIITSAFIPLEIFEIARHRQLLENRHLLDQLAIVGLPGLDHPQTKIRQRQAFEGLNLAASNPGSLHRLVRPGDVYLDVSRRP